MGQDIRSKSAFKTVIVWSIFIVISVSATFSLMPVRISIEGAGIIQPEFEKLQPISTGFPGITTKVLVSRGQAVNQGLPLFHYQPHGQYAVVAYGEMSRPGEVLSRPSDPPERTGKTESRRMTRINALNNWSSRLLRSSGKAAKWEHELARRFSAIIPAEADLEVREMIRQENIRLGRENANQVVIFDSRAGMYMPTEGGQVFLSPQAGMLYSLLVTSRLEISPERPVAEIMPDGCPLEVFGLVPASLPNGLSIGELEVFQSGSNTYSDRTQGAIFHVSRVPMTASERRELLPHLHLRGESDSFVIRIRLRDVLSREELGKSVTFRVVTEAKPRFWYWLKKFQ